MIRFLSSLLFLLLPVAPTGDWTELKFIDTAPRTITVDNLSNLYAVHEHEIRKYNEKGELLNSYSDKTLGDISLLSVSQALKPLVFYKDLGALVVLDKTMSRRGEPVYMSDQGFGQVELICPSANDHFWIYDGQDLSLKRLKPNMEVETTTGNLAQLLNVQGEPTGLKEFNERVFLNVPTKGFLVFDNFGSHIKTIPFKEASSFRVTEKRILFLKNEELMEYDRKTLRVDTIPLPSAPPIQEAHMVEDRLFTKDSSGIRILERTGKK